MKHVASILLVSSVSINILKDFQQTSHELFWVNGPHWQIRNFTKVILSKKQKITGRDPFYLTEIITLFSSHIVRCSQWSMTNLEMIFGLSSTTTSAATSAATPYKSTPTTAFQTPHAPYIPPAVYSPYHRPSVPPPGYPPPMPPVPHLG